MSVRDYIYAKLEVLREEKDELVCICPSCGDKRGHFSFNIAVGVGHCWREANCGIKCNFISLITLVEKVSWQDARKIAKEWSGDSNNHFEAMVANREKERKYKFTYPESYKPLIGDTTKFGKEALKYVLGRGITEEQVKLYSLGYSMGGKYIGYIIIPILNETDDCVSFVARKFMKLPGQDKLIADKDSGYLGRAECLFNLNNISEGATIVICEGAFDAMTVDKAVGVATAVCLNGADISDTHLLLLNSHNPSSIILFLDKDVIENRVLDCAKRLQAALGVPVKRVIFPKGEIGKDASRMPIETVRKLLHGAKEIDFQSIIRAKIDGMFAIR